MHRGSARQCAASEDATTRRTRATWSNTHVVRNRVNQAMFC